MNTLKIIVCTLALLALPLAGCSSDDSGGSSNGGTTADTTGGNATGDAAGGGGSDAQAATGGGSGECTNDGDLAIITGGQVDATGEATTCGLGCLSQPSDQQEQCSLDCVINATGLSSACAGCYASSIKCTIDECVAQCAANPESDGCLQCREDKGCTPTFYTCSGLTPPGSEPAADASGSGGDTADAGSTDDAAGGEDDTTACLTANCEAQFNACFQTGCATAFACASNCGDDSGDDCLPNCVASLADDAEGTASTEALVTCGVSSGCIEFSDDPVEQCTEAACAAEFGSCFAESSCLAAAFCLAACEDEGCEAGCQADLTAEGGAALQAVGTCQAGAAEGCAGAGDN